MPNTAFTVNRETLEVVMERTFDAPREIVWKAFNDPEAIPHWWGPKRYATSVETMDVRPGGKWRYIQRDADGNEFAFRGEYREVVPPERVSCTFEFEPMAGHVLLQTITFEDVGGTKTKVRSTSRYENIADLEGMVASGMESGATESWERAAELIGKGN